MLSEKGLLIIEKLAEHNNELVTSKALAASTGMSERSVKTYLKEVADFCEQNSMTLDRKPGKGMKPCFGDAQIGKIFFNQLFHGVIIRKSRPRRSGLSIDEAMSRRSGSVYPQVPLMARYCTAKASLAFSVPSLLTSAASQRCSLNLEVAYLPRAIS